MKIIDLRNINEPSSMQWFDLPDNESYKNNPGFSFRRAKNKKPDAYTGYKCIALLFFTNDGLKQMTDDDYAQYRRLYMKGYERALKEYEQTRDNIFAQLIDATREDKIRALFRWYAVLRNKYHTIIAFSDDMFEDMGLHSGLMFAAAEQLRMIDFFSVLPSEIIHEKVNTEQSPLSDVSFNAEPVFIGVIYNFLASSGTIPDTISQSIFLKCIEQCNFGEIWNARGVVKSKLKYAIYYIGKHMPDGWYKRTSCSIGLTPQQCSAARPPEQWIKAINDIK